jgi:hypothetical protein
VSAERAGRPKQLAGQANSVGPQAEMPAQHCVAIFLIFYFYLLFQKIVENSKIHRKYHTSQKNMKQISIESLRADLHREIYLTQFCSIMHRTKLQ